MKKKTNLDNREMFLSAAVVLLGLLVLSGVCGVVQAGTFFNATPISIPVGGASTPYPSEIIVSGILIDVESVSVTLHNLSHTWPDDIDILLVGPAGETVILMSDVGGGGPGVTNVNLTFEDGAPNLDGLPPISGTYSPTNLGTSDPFDPPAPIAPYGSTLAPLVAVNPNGTWSLYIMDDVGADAGSIADGWSITFPVSPITYQGRLDDNGVAAQGDFDLEFKLYDDPLAGVQLWPSDLKEDVSVEEGFFTEQLLFGTGVFNGQPLWLEICVRPGASVDPNDFVVLTPRQELTPAPVAHYALNVPITGLNPATTPGDLIIWDGNNWVAQQPAIQHFNMDNMQPWLGIHYIIALQGIYPSQNSADPFIAEIILFAGNFAPVGWAFCNGQLLAISSNTALFSILGTTYGGDGEVTFALPDLRGRVVVHPGSGPGLTPRSLGQKSGIEFHVK